MPTLKPLGPPDSLHLRAAQSWLDLGDNLEANAALDKITAKMRAHPEVFQVRWRILAKAERWDDCLDIARELLKLAPERRLGWLHCAESLHKLGRTAVARRLLLRALRRFGLNSAIPYLLATYCTHLGRLEEAKTWLEKTFSHEDNAEVKMRIKQLALDDPDLKPLWESMGDSPLRLRKHMDHCPDHVHRVRRRSRGRE